jgi:hypothetical protein
MTDPLPRPTDFVPDLPEGVEHILFKALAKQPEDRYEDMNALISAMEGALTEKQKFEAPVSTKPAKKKAKPSPKVVRAVIGTLTISLIIVFGTPWIKQQFSWTPETTSTVKFIAPATSTFTLLPPSATFELSPSPTLTKTPRPTPTKTPIPAWVTDFAEPILAAIKDRAPHFQDDFNFGDPKGWYAPSHPEGSLPISMEEGVMQLKEGGSASNIYIMKKANYVLQVDISSPVSCCVHVEIRGDNSIYLGNNGWGVCRQNDCSSGNSRSLSFSEQIQVTVIVKNSEACFYINGVPVFHFMDSDLETGWYSIPQFRCGTSSCKFDNVKFWNLDKIPNLP